MLMRMRAKIVKKNRPRGVTDSARCSMKLQARSIPRKRRRAHRAEIALKRLAKTHGAIEIAFAAEFEIELANRGGAVNGDVRVLQVINVHILL